MVAELSESRFTEMATQAAAVAATTSTPPIPLLDVEHFVQATLGRLNVLKRGHTAQETRVAQLMERDVAHTQDAINLYNHVQALEIDYQHLNAGGRKDQDRSFPEGGIQDRLQSRGNTDT